jgi:hypothetical protein
MKILHFFVGKQYFILLMTVLTVTGDVYVSVIAHLVLTSSLLNTHAVSALLS